MGRETETHAWLVEARERYWGALNQLKSLKRWPGESWEHYRNRRLRVRHRIEHREDVVKNLAKKLDAIRKQKEEHEVKDGFGSFDGKVVPLWMVVWLNRSRAAGWTGTVVSGVRTPEHSVELCQAQCGHDSCPGTCAGLSSNHNMTPDQGYPAGAIDVTDFVRFESIQWQIGSPLKNDLPNDPVHFSVTGH